MLGHPSLLGELNVSIFFSHASLKKPRFPTLFIWIVNVFTKYFDKLWNRIDYVQDQIDISAFPGFCKNRSKNLNTPTSLLSL